MSRIVGIGVGILVALLALSAFQHALAGWSAGHTDIGLWYTIIAGFLVIASVVAIVGSVLHTRPQPE